MLPKEFIDQVLVREIGDVVPGHPYLAFALIGTGIEYLGRALDASNKWDHTYSRNEEPPFDRAIRLLFPARYQGAKLRDRLRNGLGHFYAPKAGLGLARLTDPGVAQIITRENHPYTGDPTWPLTLVIEYLYEDFTDACRQVLATTFEPSNKMSRTFIAVPRRT